MPDALRARCTTCHGVDLIEQQRLTRGGWERELDKMIRWGAVVPDAERAVLIDYLENAMRPAAAEPPADAAGRGAELFTERCLGCHAADIVEQQRLSPAGWRRTVDKMAGWGARVAPDEKEPLASYLAARFTVR